MKETDRHAARILELRTMIAAYRQLTIEEAEQSDAGDREIEMQAELWRLEQETAGAGPRSRRSTRAA